MNRHHPYGGYDSGTRRGGYQSTSGPDRSHRFDSRGGMPVRGGRGGFARGRGGGPASYDGHMNMPSYDSSGPAYSGNFDSGAQGSYQQMNYPVGPSDYNSSNGYDNGQGYGDNNNYEGARSDDYSKRPPRRGKDEKTSEAMIEERIQREKPCRTLFIRNIKASCSFALNQAAYETDSQDIRRLFEEHGEIKTFFDLISTRGMVFVTYYDLRAAERARDRLQGSEISGRPIDVHYSLPRDDRNGDRDRNQQMQGTLQVTLRGSSSGLVIDDNEVRRKFQQFGDVKSVRPVNDRIDSRYVEFYDIRACHEAYDRLRHQGLQDGVMDILFAWDLNDEGHGSASGSGGQKYGFQL
ncbi:hypothetical protein FISHEDRAFT_47521 [Fistulina hepatica ATCC 64428]|uniref:RRM domain-containing protein n=1 Tax=Fistulina hepatica ATCC 64428 TaxID=1128425 RepID=A0A0D7A694_9AGAR|nr:hypothetical protein FISHEDRAFT_47521 [Fistulina hepatica ATCC 64428]